MTGRSNNGYLFEIDMTKNGGWGEVEANNGSIMHVHIPRDLGNTDIRDGDPLP